MVVYKRRQQLSCNGFVGNGKVFHGQEPQRTIYHWLRGNYQLLSVSALACAWSSIQVMLEIWVRIPCEAGVQFKKSQTAVSTTERYFTLSLLCLIVECTRRERKGKSKKHSDSCRLS